MSWIVTHKLQSTLLSILIILEFFLDLLISREHEGDHMVEHQTIDWEVCVCGGGGGGQPY